MQGNGKEFDEEYDKECDGRVAMLAVLEDVLICIARYNT